MCLLLKYTFPFIVDVERAENDRFQVYMGK